MTDWNVERLTRAHDRSQFDCGNPLLDAFLRTLANQYEKRDIGRTYVLVRQGERRVWGYYTLASASIKFQHLPASAKLPRHPVPVILLGRLAVDQNVRGQGLGAWLMTDALKRCLESGEAIGVHAIEVHAIDEDAQAFYEKYGFQALLDSPRHLYLPLAVIRAASD